MFAAAFAVLLAIWHLIVYCDAVVAPHARSVYDPTPLPHPMQQPSQLSTVSNQS